MKKDQKLSISDDIYNIENSWDSNPKKPYLILKEDSEPLTILDYSKSDFCLNEWRKNHCDEVTEEEFNERIKEIEKRLKEPYKKEGSEKSHQISELEKRCTNFSGLVLPKGLRRPGDYVFSIFKDGAWFLNESLNDEAPNIGYSFTGARFHGGITLNNGCIFKGEYPFLDARICKDCCFMTLVNSEDAFKKSKIDSLIKEPFLRLKIEEGGRFKFLDCHFPDGFTLRNLNLKHSFFCGSNIEKIRFINCDFAEDPGDFFRPARLLIADENTKSTSTEEKLTLNKELAVMYQLMKKSFEEQKDYQTAGKFYVSEMHFRQKDAKWFKKSVLWLYGFCAGYGESVGRAGALLFFCLSLSALFPFFASVPWGELGVFLLLFTENMFSTLGTVLEALKIPLASFLLFEEVEEATWAAIFSRILFIVSGFLFINAIRRRLRRS